MPDLLVDVNGLEIIRANDWTPETAREAVGALFLGFDRLLAIVLLGLFHRIFICFCLRGREPATVLRELLRFAAIHGIRPAGGPNDHPSLHSQT